MTTEILIVESAEDIGTTQDTITRWSEEIASTAHIDPKDVRLALKEAEANLVAHGKHGRLIKHIPAENEDASPEVLGLNEKDTEKPQYGLGVGTQIMRLILGDGNVKQEERPDGLFQTTLVFRPLGRPA